MDGPHHRAAVGLSGKAVSRLTSNTVPEPEPTARQTSEGRAKVRELVSRQAMVRSSLGEEFRGQKVKG